MALLQTEYSTYAEYLNHPRFRASVHAAVVRARWVCEVCGKRAKLHPHHLRYCPWGEFDPPEHLLMLCHECHAKAHTCSRCGKVSLKASHIKLGISNCC